MRVSALTKTPLRPHGFVSDNSPDGCLGTAGMGHWSIVQPRTPSFQTLSPASLIRVLDKGFFFPASAPWVHGGVAYRGLVLNARGRRLPPPTFRRAAALWEILEGGSVELIKKKKKPRVKRANEGYTSSDLTKFYSGLKPHKLRKRRKRLAKAPLRRLGRARRRRIKRIAGFKRALRLLPRRGRRVRSYRYLKSVRPRAALRRVARFSLLRAPLPWSKKALRVNKIRPNLGLRGGLAKLNPRASAPQRSFAPARGALSAHPIRPGRTRRRVLRVPQTRYRPGLSRAWRLLRLQFCLAWGLPWLRQRRFTNYVSQLVAVTGLSFLKMCLSSIGLVVRASALLPPSASLGDKVFVNGRYVVNPFFQVFKGDRVSLVAPSLPSAARWRAFTDVIEMPPLVGWEVDGLSRSTTVWAEPSARELQTFAFRKPLPFLTFRMYNWKYRH